jgi:hypothetical protein
VDVVFTPSDTPPDTTAPTVIVRDPVAGAAGVAVGTTAAATFSEPVQAGTVVMTVKDSAGVAVAGALAYDSATSKATFTPAAALAANTVYTVAVSNAADPSGNVMTATSWTFTTAAAAGTCPCSIWPVSAAPGTAAEQDTDAVEIGTKFRSDVTGNVTGIRFYKGTGNTGTHVGHLWSSTGQQLATVTFTGESATGWQQANFASPVTILPNTTYIVSYYAPVGRYATDAGFFASSGVDRPPLHALRDGQDGANGVYRYGTGGGFPNLSWQSSNYWVDIVFTPTG